jgi:hypothetical protein
MGNFLGEGYQTWYITFLFYAKCDFFVEATVFNNQIYIYLASPHKTKNEKSPTESLKKWCTTLFCVPVLVPLIQKIAHILWLFYTFPLQQHHARFFTFYAFFKQFYVFLRVLLKIFYTTRTVTRTYHMKNTKSVGGALGKVSIPHARDEGEGDLAHEQAVHPPECELYKLRILFPQMSRKWR